MNTNKNLKSLLGIKHQVLAKRKSRIFTNHFLIPLLLASFTIFFLIINTRTANNKIQPPINFSVDDVGITYNEELIQEKKSGSLDYQSKEFLLFTTCEQLEVCTLMVGDTAGNSEMLETSAKFSVSSSLSITKNGQHVFYKNREDQLILLNLFSSNPTKINLGAVELVNIYNNSFWVQDSDKYKLYNYEPQLLRTVRHELFSWPSQGSDISAWVKFSPNYDNNVLLAYGARNMGDGPKFTTWSLGPNNELTILYDDNPPTTNYIEPRLANLFFLEHKPGFLAIDKNGIYILHPDGTFEPLIQEQIINWYENNYFLNKDGSELYYANIKMNPGYFDDTSLYGLYKYDLNSKENKLIYKTINLNFASSLSPSEEYLENTFVLGEKTRVELVSLAENEVIPFNINSKYLYTNGWISNKGLKMLRSLDNL